MSTRRYTVEQGGGLLGIAMPLLSLRFIAAETVAKLAEHARAVSLTRAAKFLSASRGGIDENGLTWLETAPKIKLFSVEDSRLPYPLTQQEQSLLFQELPDHLARMALFKGRQDLLGHKSGRSRRTTLRPS